MTVATGARLIFYGRRVGRRIRPAQQQAIAAVQQQYPFSPALPFASQWPVRCCRYVLEIGFGDGQHLATMAGRAPDTAFLGIEPFLNGVAHLGKTLQQQQLNNVRIYADDVRQILPQLPSGQFAAVYILFPDPWPKKRHQGRRLYQADVVQQLVRLLQPQGLLAFASDDSAYVAHVLAVNQQQPDLHWQASSAVDWQQPFTHGCTTKYQQKAVAEGRQCVFLRYHKTTD